MMRNSGIGRRRLVGTVYARAACFRRDFHVVGLSDRTVAAARAMSLSVIIECFSGRFAGWSGSKDLSGGLARLGQEDGDTGLGPAVDAGEVPGHDHHPVRDDLDGEYTLAGVELRIPVLGDLAVEVEGGGVLAAVLPAVDEVEVPAPVTGAVGDVDRGRVTVEGVGPHGLGVVRVAVADLGVPSEGPA